MSLTPTPYRLPAFVAGFALLILLPILLAAFDVGLGSRTPYLTRLAVWNLPWVIVGAGVIFLTWAEVRRGKAAFCSIRPLDLGIILILAALSAVLSRTISANPQTADLHILRIGMAIMLGISAYYGMKTYQHLFSQVIYRTLIAAALGVVPFVLFFIYFQAESRALGASIVWFVPGFGAVRLFGVFYEVAIVVCIGLIVSTRARRTMVLLGVVLVILWAALFWSGGRGALLSLFLTLGLGSLFYRKKAAKMWAVFLISGLFGGLLSLLLWVPDRSSFGLMNLLQSVMREDANAFSAGRIERWIATIGMIGERPFFGNGLSQFSNLWSGYTIADERAGISASISTYFLSYRHVHNIVLEALLSWGLIGGGLFLLLLFKTWLTAAKKVWVGVPLEKLPAFLALNALLFHANFTGIYIFPHSLFYMAIFFGICLAPNPAQNKNTSG